jgi:phosphoglycolate phosphatase
VGTAHDYDVIFDFDGVLADSPPLIISVLRPAIEAAIGLRPSEADLRAVIGPPFRQSVALLCARLGVHLDDPSVEEVVQRFRVDYAQRVIGETPMYPGIESAVERLAMSYRLSICSSKPRPMVEGIIRAWGIEPRFAAVQAADPERDEPKALLLERLIATGRMRPEQSVVIGDTRFDAIAAAAAKIPMIGVAWGVGEPSELRSQGAVAIARDPEHLVDVIKRAFGTR